MLMWPLVFNQFIKERLATDVLRIGERVWSGAEHEVQGEGARAGVDARHGGRGLVLFVPAWGSSSTMVHGWVGFAVGVSAMHSAVFWSQLRRYAALRGLLRSPQKQAALCGPPHLPANSLVAIADAGRADRRRAVCNRNAIHHPKKLKRPGVRIWKLTCLLQYEPHLSIC
jgi:hypothetical protein